MNKQILSISLALTTVVFSAGLGYAADAKSVSTKQTTTASKSVKSWIKYQTR